MGLCFLANDPEKQSLKVEKFNFNNTTCTSRFKRCMWKSRVRHYTSKKERKWENIKAIVEERNRSGG
jgi:hypothetical protein